jgi:signal transduction histidine kinase
MRRILILSYLMLAVLMLLGLEGPLIYSSAMNEFHQLNTARQTEAARFAALAVPVLRGGDGSDLERQFRAYDSKLDVTVLLVDVHGEVVLRSRPGAEVTDGGWLATLRRALAGDRSDPPDYPFNVSAIPLFVVQPVREGDTTLGAVATISPTTQLRSTMIGQMAIFIAVGVLGMVAAVAFALPFTRWVLRPVGAVSEAAREIAEGDLDARAPAGSGPPEIRRLSTSVNQMADRLVTLLRAQRSFVADASHQLRNPLTSLRLRVETLEPLISNGGADHVRAAVAEAERLSRILDELLALVRAEGAGLATAPVDVPAVARLRARAWQPRADERGVRINVDGGCAVRALATPGAVDQVLDVLLDNAINVSPPDGRVTVRVADRGADIELRVTDEGPGMSEQDCARAFDRFWRGSGSDRRDGSGLGLAIAQALITANAGRIRLAPVHPHGLDAMITLPAAVGVTLTTELQERVK